MHIYYILYIENITLEFRASFSGLFEFVCAKFLKVQKHALNFN